MKILRKMFLFRYLYILSDFNVGECLFLLSQTYYFVIYA